MKLLIVLGGVASLLLIWCLWYTLRQLHHLCRQLHFLQEHDSNMLLRTDTRFGYLGELTDCYNELFKPTPISPTTYARRLLRWTAISSFFPNAPLRMSKTIISQSSENESQVSKICWRNCLLLPA